MRITAKHEGRCTACGVALTEGDAVEWEKLFGARCLACATARRYPPRRNERGQPCLACGIYVAPGMGELVPVGATEWAVRCTERLGCATRAERQVKGLVPPGMP